MDKLDDPTAEASIVIDAEPAVVWGVVSDVTRTPEWSPVCRRTEWLGDAGRPEVGARFRGHNRLNGARWSRECVVTESEPGASFGFSTLFKDQESTRWRYRTEAENGGTRLTQSYQVILMPAWVRLFRRLPGAIAKSERDMAWNMQTSLERIKALAEASG